MRAWCGHMLFVWKEDSGHWYNHGLGLFSLFKVIQCKGQVKYIKNIRWIKTVIKNVEVPMSWDTKNNINKEIGDTEKKNGHQLEIHMNCFCLSMKKKKLQSLVHLNSLDASICILVDQCYQSHTIMSK